ncbi:hypothetical protein CLV59_103249 [Chitinophaga dinghuensis]|uniref:Uncharacterized protein n=1 Tax=Chitinophaga dinghuensis TaxID=1539050 RepID=A0A327W541_9BACT|nr:hypothetical protein [Chitinophaga dinghuensis]RAJ83285.1 hypothetical protein CLV59_103249 [Chitinophaga dinghuensis]
MIYSKVILTAAIGLSIVACNASKSTNPPIDAVKTASEPDSLIGKNNYANPVDGKVYASSEKFKEYTPDGGTRKPKGPNYVKNVTLLTTQQEVPGIVSIDTLAEFIKGQEAFVLKNIQGIKTVGRLLIQFHLHHGAKPTVMVSYDGDFDKNQLQQLDADLRQYCVNHRTKKDSVVYQMLFMVNDANYAK